MRLFLLLLFLVLVTAAGPAAALGPVNLLTGMTGAFPWSASGIMPGSSNATFIELHNNGTARGGPVHLAERYQGGRSPWQRNRLWKLPVPECFQSPTLGLIPLPAKPYAFPTAPMLANYIVVYPFSPGETIRLNWTWEFRETGETPERCAGRIPPVQYLLHAGNPPPPTPPTTVPTPPPTVVPNGCANSADRGTTAG